MNIFSNNIPTNQVVTFVRTYKFSKQVIPEQYLEGSVSVYKDAIPYIECELKSTIQHEAAHRQDEQDRNELKTQGKETPSFDEFSAKSRVEPIAEKAEEPCKSLLPSQLSNEVSSINIQSLFEKAKSSANINNSFKRDIRAGTLQPEAQGMYLMQDMPNSVAVESGNRPNQYEGFDGTLWIDVRKIIDPFVVKNPTYPSNIQTDGMEPDNDLIRGNQFNREVNTIPTVPSANSVPSVPSIQGR